MEDLVNKFNPYLKDPVFVEVLDLVKQNSKGKIWIIGGFLYKNLANALYGEGIYNFDIDFIVEERNDSLKEIDGWKIQTNNYGSQNYVREKNKMSFTDLRKAIRVNKLKNPTIEEFIKETPLNVQSIAYDLEENKIIGQKGIEAMKNRMIMVNSKEQADFYAKRKGRDIDEIIKEKATELGFDHILCQNGSNNVPKGAQIY
jgi:hypothetical protein